MGLPTLLESNCIVFAQLLCLSVCVHICHYTRNEYTHAEHVLTSISSSHSPTLDLDIGQVAQGAEFFRSDGVIVTGVSTGAPASLKELDTVQQAVRLPLLVGSGVNTDNLEQYLGRVDGMIVGSEFKAGGVWSNDIDIDRVKCFMRRKHELLQP